MQKQKVKSDGLEESNDEKHYKKICRNDNLFHKSEIYNIYTVFYVEVIYLFKLEKIFSPTASFSVPASFRQFIG